LRIVSKRVQSLDNNVDLINTIGLVIVFKACRQEERKAMNIKHGLYLIIWDLVEHLRSLDK